MNGNGKDKITEQIEGLLTSGENVKNLYRFLANNPDRDLFENCQIIINRPNASICKSFSAWNDEGRRITAGRKGIPYYDKSGAKHFVFDVSDTHGEGRYLVRILPLKHLLTGLDELNGVKASESGNDYARIYNGVSVYLKQNRLLSGEENYDKALTEGAAFSLYVRTGFPKTKDINLNGLNFSLKENILLLKDVSEITARLESDIEDTYYSKQSEVEIVNDTDEENISDEPIPEQVGEKSEEHSEERETLNPLYKQYTEIQGKNKNAVVFMRLGDFYEAYGDSAEKAAKALDLTLTGKNVGLKERVLLCGVPYYAAEKYIEKLAESYTVITVDGIVERTFTKEEKREDATERSENKGDKQSPKLISLEEDEESPFDEDDYTDDNPKIKRKMEVDGEISRLRVLESEYRKNLYSLQDKEINEQLDAEAVQERVTSIINRLQIDMTKWAADLGMEYANNPYRLDLNKLTVVTDTVDGPIFLKTMGSGSNWLDSHIITYFALQKYLQEYRRPVPAFIFMDQPSQVYFPDETDENKADWNEIKRLYEFIFNTAASIGNGLQVIVVDHAKYEDDKFTSHVVEDWHSEQKLIPEDWHKDA